MKRYFAAALAALLIFSLTACAPKAETPPQSDAPQAQVPDAPQSDAPTAAAPEVAENVDETTLDDMVGVTVTTPSFTLPSKAAAQTVNDYFALLAGKAKDYAEGEVYENAMENHTVLNLNAGYEITLQTEKILSILWTVTVTDSDENAVSVTRSGATFNVESGGLLLLSDLLTGDDDATKVRLTDIVRNAIASEENVASRYNPLWEELVTTSFDRDRFYLTADALVVFYPAGELGADATNVFPISYETISEIMAFEP